MINLKEMSVKDLNASGDAAIEEVLSSMEVCSTASQAAGERMLNSVKEAIEQAKVKLRGYPEYDDINFVMGLDYVCLFSILSVRELLPPEAVLVGETYDLMYGTIHGTLKCLLYGEIIADGVNYCLMWKNEDGEKEALCEYTCHDYQAEEVDPMSAN